LMQLPPPVHGASMMNDYIKNSKVLNNQFDCTYLNISTATSISDIGKFNVRKLISLYQLYCAFFRVVRKEKFDIIYITLSPHGSAFYKDSFFATVGKLFCNKVVVHLHGKGINKQIA